MANNYKMAGYTTPRGVNDSRSVKEWQRKLGVTPDGIWGKNTQAAYDKYLANPVTLTKDDRGAQKRSLRVLDTMGKLGESKASYGASAVGAGASKDAVGSYFANTAPATNPTGYATGLGLVNLPQAEVKKQSAVAEFISNSSVKGLQKGYLPQTTPDKESAAKMKAWQEEQAKKARLSESLAAQYFESPKAAADAFQENFVPYSKVNEHGAMIYETEKGGETAYRLGNVFEGNNSTVAWKYLPEYARSVLATALGAEDTPVGMVHSHPDPGKGYHNDFPSYPDLLLYYLPYMNHLYMTPYKTDLPGTPKLIDYADEYSWDHGNWMPTDNGDMEVREQGHMGLKKIRSTALIDHPELNIMGMISPVLLYLMRFGDPLKWEELKSTWRNQ